MDTHPRALARAATRWLGEAAVWAFPAVCFACERSLPRIQLVGACMPCWSALSSGPRARCERCALPLPDDTNRDGPARGRCARCVIRPLPFSRATAAVDYSVGAKRFLLRAKSGHRVEVLRPLAKQLATTVRLSRIADGIDGVVPVPASLLSRWRRGFNPAGELAYGVARDAGIPVLGGILRKRGLAGTEVKGLNASARWAGADRSISACRMIPGARILLVDDVLTTGATAAACARALRIAGAVEIRVAVWARTPFVVSGFDQVRVGRL